MRRAVLLLGSLVLLSCAPKKGPHDSEGTIPMGTEAPFTREQSAALRAQHPIKTVWVIVMENKSWKHVHRSPSAPYINDTLLKIGAHAERYDNDGVHPSEPNYIWMEAGDRLEISDNDDPYANFRTTKHHLTNQLEAVGVTWRSFPEGIDGTACPLQSAGAYKAKHTPFVYFEDITDGRHTQSRRCMEHVRPYWELLTNGAQYNFITPHQCHDMHDTEGCETPDAVKNGDLFLSREVPKIMATDAYKTGGAIFITWDEGTEDADEPLGLIVVSPFAKPGYSNEIPYNHGSLVRTFQDIFAVRPYLRSASRATSLADLFVQFPAQK